MAWKITIYRIVMPKCDILIYLKADELSRGESFIFENQSGTMPYIINKSND